MCFSQQKNKNNPKRIFQLINPYSSTLASKSHKIVKQTHNVVLIILT